MPFYNSFANEPISWKQDKEGIALNYGDKNLWEFKCQTRKMKPYFHPLNTIYGDRFTDAKHGDHPWHYGLWWSFKKINSVNYWEEPKGKSPDGTTEVRSFKSDLRKDGSCQIEISLVYYPASAPQNIVIKEERVISVSAPDVNGNYSIDWDAKFETTQDLILGRTPVRGQKNGKPYGGYAGLSVRFQKKLQKWKFSGENPSKSAKTSPSSIYRKHTSWICYSGSFSNNEGALSMFEHPQNQAFSNSKAYVNHKLPYLSQAFLYDEDLSLKKKGTNSASNIVFRFIIKKPEYKVLENLYKNYSKDSSKNTPARDKSCCEATYNRRGKYTVQKKWYG